MRKFIEDTININNQPITFQNPWRDFLDYIGNNLESKLFLVKKARQVGLSTLTRAMELALCCTESKIHLMHLHPTLAQANMGGKELGNLILDAKKGTIAKRNGVLKSVLEEKIPWEPMANTKLFKRFGKENTLRTDSIGTDACRLRGISVDGIIFDEAQCMKKEAIGYAIKALTTSKFGTGNSQIYLFTPQKPDYLEEMWNSSGKNEWNYICPVCSRSFPITVRNWKSNWVNEHNIKCPLCDTVFDKRTSEGKWIGNPDKEYQGFHFHQGMLDSVTKEMVLEQEKILSPEMFYNEVFGEYYDFEKSLQLKS